MATTKPKRRQPSAQELEVVRKRLSGLTHEEKVQLVAKASPIADRRGKKTSKQAIPQTDDELHAAIIRETGFDIPRVSVCEDHCAPFDLVSAGFFHRVEGILNLKSREAGGTLNASILQYMLCKFMPGHEGVQFGAIRDQAEKAFCVTGDTLIDCPRDHRKHPAGIPISEVKPGQLVWTFNRDDHRFELKRVVKTWISAPRAEVWRLTLDSGDVIRATSNHRFLLRSNEWRELGDLSPGDSLMPMYRDYEPMVWTMDGKKKEHYEVAHAAWGYPRPDGVVHHVDHYHANTAEANLELIPAAEHNRLHALARWEVATPEERAEMGRRRRAGRRKNLGGELSARIATENGSRLRLAIQQMSPEERELDSQRRSELMKQFWADASPEWRQDFARRLREGLELMDPETRAASIQALHLGRKNQAERLRWSRTKTCVTCKAEKPLGMFEKKHSGRGYLSRCSSCYADEGRQSALDALPPSHEAKRIRERASVSRRAFADKLGVSLGSLRRWELGEVRPRGASARKYLEALRALSESSTGVPYNHRVVSVEFDGYEEVWDMEVADNHNFVVHGVVLHNSYVKRFTEERVQDADGSYTRRIKSDIDGEPLQKRIAWTSGSLLQIIVGTVSGVNSPHPNTVHADEVDLMDQDVIDQSNNMSSSSLMVDGRRIPALDVVVSTRKSMHGPMQRLMDEVEEAEQKGHEASYSIFSYCVFEVAEEVPNCRRVSPEQRQPRLKELGLDPCSLCDCDNVVKGEWSENNPRTLESVCGGKFFRSRGWLPHIDVKRKFRKNSQAVWEAEMECRRPMADGLYLPSWTRQRYTCRDWMPRPEFGNVWTSTDWGGSAESAVLWVQGPLRVPVSVAGPNGTVTIPIRSYVTFDELLEARIGAMKLGDQVIAREIGWRRKVPGFRITARFADMAGRQQREDWREHDPPLRTVWHLPNRDFDPMVKNFQDVVGDGRYWVDSKCSRHMDDIESWRQKKGREVHDESSHSAASARYLLANTEALERRRGHRQSAAEALPVVVQRAQPLHVAAVGVSGGDPLAAERKWREKLGESFPNGGRRW